jgi:hypothetical protein
MTNRRAVEVLKESKKATRTDVAMAMATVMVDNVANATKDDDVVTKDGEHVVAKEEGE